MAKHLPKHFVVTFPSQHEQVPIVKDIMLQLAIKLGGYTLTSGRGAYVRQDDGSLQLEPVTILTAYFDERTQSVAHELRRMLVDKLHLVGEESVLVEYDHPAGGHLIRALVFGESLRVEWSDSEKMWYTVRYGKRDYYIDYDSACAARTTQLNPPVSVH
ncbi:hypothetical protein [Xanthomonas phage SB3]|uniref:Uncharacterized protein n=1 Tax=Xanthomonas phage SB3 TaxID=3117472 RepID=A0ABZ2GY13_9CAUD